MIFFFWPQTTLLIQRIPQMLSQALYLMMFEDMFSFECRRADPRHPSCHGIEAGRRAVEAQKKSDNK